MAKTATATFESILDTPATEVERPTPMPAGTYDAIVQGLFDQGESSKKKTPFVRFTYKFTSAFDDVDTDELATVLGDAPLTDKTIKDTYYTTPDALFRLTDTLEAMGIDLADKTVRHALDETPNASVRIVIGHRPSEDGTQIFAEVKRVMKAE